MWYISGIFSKHGAFFGGLCHINEPPLGCNAIILNVISWMAFKRSRLPLPRGKKGSASLSHGDYHSHTIPGKVKMSGVFFYLGQPCHQAFSFIFIQTHCIIYTYTVRIVFIYIMFLHNDTYIHICLLFIIYLYVLH